MGIKIFKVVLPFLLGVALFAGLLYINNAPEHLAMIELDPIYFLVTIAINFLLYAVLTRRWQLMIRGIDASVSWTECLFYYVTAVGLGVFIPNSAAMISMGAGALERFHQIPLKKGIATIILEKGCDLFLIIFSAPPVLLLILNVISVQQAVLLLLVMLVLMTICLIVLIEKTNIMNHPVIKRISQIDINRRTLLKVVGLTLVTQGLQVMRVWLIAKTVGIDIALPIAMLGLAGNQASSLLSITPGGLGLKEGAFYLIFNAAGIAAGQIGVYTIAFRGLTSLFLLLFWLLLYFFWIVTQNR